ncbi:MAG: AAA family ATPase [Chitinivibrionales bacterium]|nr:AAA family ATPase [Chitinivibrionales bacterium]
MRYKRFLQTIHTTSFLFGPRGTGKSTWLKEKYPHAAYIDMLNSETFRYYSAFPERALRILDDYPQKECFIIDEVQKVPDILSNLHSFIEDHKDILFILTGSSSRKLKAKGVDLLAGRALLKTFHPFMASELGNDFDIDKALTLGMVPLVLTSSAPLETQRSYINLYLNEEVKEEGLTRNIGNFTRFLEIISFSQGSVLNLSEISRDSEVKRNTLDSYVSILEDLLIAVRIPVFSHRAKRELIRSRKFYFFDCGVFQGIRTKGPLEDAASLRGTALETLVMQHLRAWIEYSGKEIQLYFWRTRGGSEVDFIIYGENTFFAFEVKNTRNPRAKDTSGLRSFGQDYPPARLVLLYRGKEKKRRDGVDWIPVERFLRALSPDMSMQDVCSIVS